MLQSLRRSTVLLLTLLARGMSLSTLSAPSHIYNTSFGPFPRRVADFALEKLTSFVFPLDLQTLLLYYSAVTAFPLNSLCLSCVMVGARIASLPYVTRS